MLTAPNQLKRELRLFLLTVFFLLIIGTVFVYSASSVFALEKCGSADFFLKKHLLGIVLGFGALMIARFMPLIVIKELSPLFFLLSLGLTALTLFESLSPQIHGSHRWLSLYGHTFQPSELLKMSFLLFTARFLSRRPTSALSIKALIPYVTLFSLGILILLKQPDFGMSVTFVLTLFIIFYLLQIHTRLLFVGAALAVPIGILLIYMKSYRWRRVVTFFNPWNDRQGAGFQLIQSLIAIGSGSWFGVGISHSKQKFFYLPMQHTDFIFAIIAEETGFLGSLLIIFLFVAFLYYGMRLATKMKDQFSAIFTLGFVVMTTLQATINIAVTTGLLPTKGIGLPFISYGNSSLICSMAMVGVVMNCVCSERKNRYS
jgi:cell division protein FtsW